MSTDRSTSSNAWDFGRFLKTWSYFGAIPFLSRLDWFQHMFDSRPHGVLQPLESPQPTVLLIGRSVQHPALIDALGQQGYAVKILSDPQGGSPIGGDRSTPSVTVIPASLSVQSPDAASVLDNLSVILYDGSGDPTAPDYTELKTLLQAINQGGTRTITPLFNFAQPTPALRQTWGALDDVVMGGVSESGIRQVEQWAIFSGVVSTANSGGFASIRTRNFDPPLDLSAYEGLALRLRGEGQRYKLLVRSENQWDGLAYSHSFDTVADQWITIHIPFGVLIPVFRAKTVPSAGPMATHRITALQLMLSKFEYDGALNPQFKPGPFRLDIATLGAYQGGDRPQVILSNPDPDLFEQVRQDGFSPVALAPRSAAAEDWVQRCMTAIAQGGG